MTMATLHLIKSEASYKFFYIRDRSSGVDFATYAVQTGKNFYNILVIPNPTRIYRV